jgi:patatin-like phospholipase/acyl hydrolase
LDGIGVKLAYNPELLEQAEKVIEEKIKSADFNEKKRMYNMLLTHLDEYAKKLKPEAEKQNVAPEDLPEYQEEEKRIREFISRYLSDCLSME